MQPELVHLGSEPERKKAKEFCFIEQNTSILDRLSKN